MARRSGNPHPDRNNLAKGWLVRMAMVQVVAWLWSRSSRHEHARQAEVRLPRLAMASALRHFRTLDQLEREALDEIKAGRTEPLDPDKL